MLYRVPTIQRRCSVCTLATYIPVEADFIHEGDFCSVRIDAFRSDASCSGIPKLRVQNHHKSLDSKNARLESFALGCCDVSILYGPRYRLFSKSIPRKYEYVQLANDLKTTNSPLSHVIAYTNM